MSKLEDLAERVERLVLRHEELQRTNALLQQQLGTLGNERDNLRSRLSAAISSAVTRPSRCSSDLERLQPSSNASGPTE